MPADVGLATDPVPVDGDADADAHKGLVRRAAPKVLLVLAIVVAVFVVLRSGLVESVGDEEKLRETVDEAGFFGPVLFVGLMVLLVPLNVPGILFVIPSTTLFGTAGGIGLSLVGGFIASLIGVVGARHLGRGTVEARLPWWLRRLERWLGARGFWTVAALRATTFLAQPVDWICGLTAIPMRTMIAGTFVGLIPPTVVVALAGGTVVDLVFG